jgi:hypothetical protein
MAGVCGMADGPTEYRWPGTLAGGAAGKSPSRRIGGIFVRAVIAGCLALAAEGGSGVSPLGFGRPAFLVAAKAVRGLAELRAGFRGPSGFLDFISQLNVREAGKISRPHYGRAPPSRANRKTIFDTPARGRI